MSHLSQLSYSTEKNVDKPYYQKQMTPIFTGRMQHPDNCC